MLAGFSGTPNRPRMPSVSSTPITSGVSAISVCRRLRKSKNSTAAITRKAYRPARCRPSFIALRPSTVPNGLPVASGSTVLHLLGEMFQRAEVPQAILGEHAQQPFAVRADVALAQVGRQVGQGDRPRRRNLAQPVQVLGQVAGQFLFKDLQLLRRRPRRLAAAGGRAVLAAPAAGRPGAPGRASPPAERRRQSLRPTPASSARSSSLPDRRVVLDGLAAARGRAVEAAAECRRAAAVSRPGRAAPASPPRRRG